MLADAVVEDVHEAEVVAAAAAAAVAVEEEPSAALDILQSYLSNLSKPYRLWRSIRTAAQPLAFLHVETVADLERSQGELLQSRPFVFPPAHLVQRLHVRDSVDPCSFSSFKF